MPMRTTDAHETPVYYSKLLFGLSIIGEEDHVVILQSWNAFGGDVTDQSKLENICYSEDMKMLAGR